MKAGYQDKYQRETTKAMKMLKNDMEYAILRSTLLCGASAVKGQMKGIKYWLSIVTAQSGVSLTEKQLNTYFAQTWEQGVEVDAIYAPMYIKQKISAFTANGTKYFDQNDKRLLNAVDVYSADAARLVKLFPHRYVTISGTDVNYDIVGIKEDMFKVAYLRKPLVRELAKTGDATKGEVLSECTLECLNGFAGFFGAAHL